MNKSDAPQIISLSAADLEKLLGELRGPLAPATYQLVEACCEPCNGSWRRWNRRRPAWAGSGG
jgi:hypothetical protein